MRLCLWLIVLLMLPAAAVRADFFDDYLTDPSDGQLDASRYLSEVPGGFLPVPTIITEPAVGYGFGVVGVFFHESADQRKKRTQQGVLLPENISLLGGVRTENGTWGLGAGQLGFWRGDTIRYKGFLLYGSLNLDFYSLASVELPRPVELNLDGPLVYQELTWRLPETQWFVGGRQFYRKVEVTFAGNAELPAVPAAAVDYLADHIDGDNTTSGLGVVVAYDSRDNPFNPERGYNYLASFTVFDQAIGSDVDYESFNVTALNYWTLHERFVLGLRMQLDGVDADDGKSLPPYVPPYIQLRGVAASRYQGIRVGVAEVQVDYKITPRWKVSLFTGMGRTADSVSDFGDADNIDSVGVGFRYLMARRYGFAMGLDVARSEEESAFYIQAGSAW